MNRLNIYDGPDENSKIIGEIYGNSNNKLVKSISTAGKSMFIDFKKSDVFGEETTEFLVLINYDKIIYDCQTWLDIKKNILVSPDQLNSTNCSWLITSNFGSYIILSFKFIEVKFIIFSNF